ncbi:Endonuclease Reverse transcriptase, partial [Phytophthora megakarya]
MPHHRDATNQRWNTVLNKAMEAAADTEQRRLRLLIYNDHAQDAKALRRQRNAILHQIRERSKSIATAYIDEKLTTMQESSPSARLFTATRALFQKRSPLTSLLDSEGKYILSRKAAGKKIKHHFQEQFIDPHRQPVPDDGLKQPLESPIEAEELERAFKRLRNGRAAGPDAIPAELLKYGASILAQPLADIINHGLTTGDNIHLGDGILLGLPKPNKPAGQCARVMGSSSDSPNQTNRLANAERFHILGIDLSRAFDTVNRDKLLSVLEDIVNNDEMRLIRLLLRGTNLSLRLDNSTLLSPFESNTAALRDLASELGTDHDLLADMIVYADDADFVCRQPEIAALIEAQAPAILAKWSLQMNTTKTEHTEILRSPTACSTRISRKIHEAWRNTRKLGSLLGDTEDLSRRKNLASAAFHRLWKIWLRPLRTSEETRVRLYNCYVLPILLYNSGAWALTQADLVGLERFHRQQLRQVIGVRYPDWISNDKLYDRTGTEPLRYVLLRNRWRLFGHILRRPTNIPAFRFMDAYFARGKQGSWRDRRRLTLPLTERVGNDSSTGY